MNNINTLAIRFKVASAGAFLALAVAAPAMGADKDQRDRKVLVENDKVIVTETRYKPGSSSGMLERRARVARALTNGTLEKTFADGRKEKITWKVGQVRYNPTETFDQKNTGKKDVVLYVVTLK